MLVGLISLIVAVKANRRADEANELAQGANNIATEANGLSRDANQIAERALKSSDQIGRDQIALHQRELEVIHQAERRKRSADIQVTPTTITSAGKFNLRLENRGPHHADRVTVSLHDGGQSMTVGGARSIAPGTSTQIEGHRGTLLAGSIDTEVDDLSRPEGQILELRVTFTDGNGPQSVHKRLTISPGSRFSSRDWSIDDWPATE
jgi:hypothetical protein